MREVGLGLVFSSDVLGVADTGDRCWRSCVWVKGTVRGVEKEGVRVECGLDSVVRVGRGVARGGVDSVSVRV